MVMQVNNNDQANVRTLQIESKQLLPNVLPTLSIGDVVNVTVRQNPPQGQGLIYFKGLLVKANLPPSVTAGDKLLAKLTESDNQVVLKILEQTKTPVIETAFTLPEILSDLQELINQQPAQGLKAPAPMNLSQVLTKALELEQRVQNLFSGIPTLENLHDSKATLDQLLKAADGSGAENLRAMAAAIKTFVEKNSPTDSQRQMIALRDTMEQLLDSIASNNTETADLLGQLDDSLQQSLKGKVKVVLDRDQTKQLLTKLQSRPMVTNAEYNQELQPTVQGALARLNAELGLVSSNTLLDRRIVDDLLQVATRFEQMAQTQEVLGKLNPVMQSLGEPAMLLFPFLFQGLISHSEVTIESRTKVRGEEESGSGKKRGNSAEPFQRVQVTVPLPTMGSVDVDIAHRTSEILVRFTVTEKPVRDFLLAELENLAPILKELGFERAELVSHVGARQETQPAWTFGLHSATSIIA